MSQREQRGRLIATLNGEHRCCVKVCSPAEMGSLLFSSNLTVQKAALFVLDQ